MLVRELQAVTQLGDDVEFLLERQWWFDAHSRGETLAAQKFHDDIRNTVFFGKLENSDDVAMLKLCRCTRLTKEAGARVRVDVTVERVRHYFDRDFAIQRDIDALVQHAHTAAADSFNDPISADLLVAHWRVAAPGLGASGLGGAAGPNDDAMRRNTGSYLANIDARLVQFRRYSS